MTKHKDQQRIKNEKPGTSSSDIDYQNLQMSDEQFIVPSKALIEAMAKSNLNGTDWSVMLCLLFYANRNTGKCFPSVATIAKFSGKSKRAIFKSLDRLQELNFVKYNAGGIIDGKHKANEYFINDIHYHFYAFESGPDGALWTDKVTPSNGTEITIDLSDMPF